MLFRRSPILLETRFCYFFCMLRAAQARNLCQWQLLHLLLSLSFIYGIYTSLMCFCGDYTVAKNVTWTFIMWLVDVVPKPAIYGYFEIIQSNPPSKMPTQHQPNINPSPTQHKPNKSPNCYPTPTRPSPTPT
jgi:hypothetical protein